MKATRAKMRMPPRAAPVERLLFVFVSEEGLEGDVWGVVTEDDGVNGAERVEGAEDEDGVFEVGELEVTGLNCDMRVLDGYWCASRARGCS